MNVRNTKLVILGALALFWWAVLGLLFGDADACEGLYLGAGVYDHSGANWNDAGEVGTSFEAGYIWRWSDFETPIYTDCGFRHHSQLMAGEPFDGALEETELNAWGCTARFFVW